MIGFIVTLLIFSITLYLYIPGLPKFGLEPYGGITQYIMFFTIIVLTYYAAMSLRYWTKPSYLRYEDQYLALQNKKSWRDAQNIIMGTKINEFDHNYPAQKEVMGKCHDFVGKHYSNKKDLYPSSDILKDDTDYYASSIECSNMAKMKQAAARKKMEYAHDTCIEHLKESDDPAQYQQHMSAIMGDLGQKEKYEQFKDCKTRME